jgi:hypothetical protein
MEMELSGDSPPRGPVVCTYEETHPCRHVKKSHAFTGRCLKYSRTDMGLPVSCQDVSVRIQSSRPFPPSLSEIVFDSYRIRPIPTSDGEEAILQFKDEWVEGQMASHPVQEGKFVLSWLGLVRLLASNIPSLSLIIGSTATRR